MSDTEPIAMRVLLSDDGQGYDAAECPACRGMGTKGGAAIEGPKLPPVCPVCHGSGEAPCRGCGEPECGGRCVYDQ